MAALVQEATVPEEELVAAASQLRLDDVKVARSFCKVFAARARAAEAHGARAKAFGEWRRYTERAAPAAPASATPRKRRRTPLKALENIQPTSGGKPRSARSPLASGGKPRSGRRSKSPPRGTPHPYVPPPPPPESPAVASPRRVRWSPVAPAAAAATPEKAAVRRDLFSRDADEKDAAVPAKEDAPLALPSPAKTAPLALRPRQTPPPKTPADASPVVSPAPRVTPTEAAEQTGAFTGVLGSVARRSDEAPKVVTPYGSKLEKWRDKYRAGYNPRPAPESFGERVARPFRFTRPAVGWRCNLCFARNAADAASCELCHEAKPEAAAA